jgi:hypothetical protein
VGREELQQNYKIKGVEKEYGKIKGKYMYEKNK